MPRRRRCRAASVALFCTLASLVTFSSTSHAEVDVVGGTPTKYARWKGVVNMYVDGPGCTVVLLSPTVGLTAHHCAENFISEPMRIAIVGGSDLTEESTVVPHATVQSIALFPQASNANWFNQDIALLRLQSPVTTAPYYAIDRSHSRRISTVGTIVGYGSTAFGIADHGVAREGRITIANPFPGDPNNAYSLYFTGPSAACHGDSGAPLFFERQQEWWVTAIVSGGENCDPDQFGYATRLAPRWSWLNATHRSWTGEDLPRTGGMASPAPWRIMFPMLSAL